MLILWIDPILGSPVPCCVAESSAPFDPIWEGELSDLDCFDELVRIAPDDVSSIVRLCYALGMREVEAQTSQEDNIDFSMRCIANCLEYLSQTSKGQTLQ